MCYSVFISVKFIIKKCTLQTHTFQRASCETFIWTSVPGVEGPEEDALADQPFPLQAGFGAAVKQRVMGVHLSLAAPALLAASYGDVCYGVPRPCVFWTLCFSLHGSLIHGLSVTPKAEHRLRNHGKYYVICFYVWDLENNTTN